MADAEPLTVRTLTGAAVGERLDGLARLRLEVFRAWPYLYAGTLDYERWYLERFARAEGAVLVAVFDGDALVGAATAVPLEHEHAAFVEPLRAQGYAVERTFYLAESVLLPAYRRRGLGHRFFDLREAAARGRGATHATFCAVVRPDDHPLRPRDNRPLDPFWRKRGYAPLPDLLARFAWQDVDQAEPTEKPMQVWIKTLAAPG